MTFIQAGRRNPQSCWRGRRVPGDITTRSRSHSCGCDVVDDTGHRNSSSGTRNTPAFDELAADLERNVESHVPASAGCRRRGFRYLSLNRIQQHQASRFSPQLSLFTSELPWDEECVLSKPLPLERGGGVGPMRYTDSVYNRRFRFIRPLQVSPA
jgi:hypothetical protein